MNKLMPFIFLIAVFSIFGLSWIIVRVDPQNARWYIFVLFILILFSAIFCLSTIAFYFLNAKIHKGQKSNSFLYSSFKYAFLIAFLASLIAALAILQQASLFNIILAILAVSFLALWSYVGRK